MQILQIEDPTKWKTSKEDSQRERAKENTGRSKKWSSLNEWCDNWNVSAERQQYSRYFDVISSGTCGDVPGMTDWSTDILISVCQRSQGQGTNQEKQKQGSKMAQCPVGGAHDWQNKRKSLTISYCRNWCKHVPNDDFTCFHVEKGAAGEKGSNTTTGMWCAATAQERRMWVSSYDGAQKNWRPPSVQQMGNPRTGAVDTLRCQTWQRPEEMVNTSSYTARKVIKALKENTSGACGTQKKEEKQSCTEWKSTPTRKTAPRRNIFVSVSSERLVSQEPRYKRKGSGEVNPSFSGEEEELSYFPGQEHEFGSAPMNEDVCARMERVRGRLAFGRLVFFSLNALRSACLSGGC